MKLSLTLEQVNNSTDFRAIVFETDENNCTSVYDIGEGNLGTLRRWMRTEHPTCNAVRMRDGSIIEPDCITVTEAAETVMDWIAESDRTIYNKLKGKTD